MVCLQRSLRFGVFIIAIKLLLKSCISQSTLYKDKMLLAADGKAFNSGKKLSLLSSSSAGINQLNRSRFWWL
jgi:hypothetical protein